MKPYHTDIAWSSSDSITVFGRSLPDEILGHLSFGDMAFLELTARVPTQNESRMFNAMLVTLVEHGLTPSTMVARLTYLGAPEAMQAAVAAGLSGLGSVFVGSVEGSAKMLSEAMPTPGASVDQDAIARSIVEKFAETKAIIPGIGFDGPYVSLIQKVAAEAGRARKRDLPTNATGMLGALCCEMGFDWKICRGLGVMARAVGIVGHILEESRNPMAANLWLRTEEEATNHFRAPKP